VIDSSDDIRDGAAGNVPTRISADQALEVLSDLESQLGDVDPDARAIVGLRADAPGSVSLVDVELKDNGVLEAPDPIHGLVVVTTEQVAHGEDVVPLQQFVCVLPDGTEVGVYRAGESDELHSWRSDRDDDEAAGLRPRDTASNTARRALGLPSLVDDPMSITELVSRVWLMTVASEAIQRFDAPEGPRDVEVEELQEVADRPLLGGAVEVNSTLPTWAEIHEAAVEGKLQIGPLSVDPEHAAWLDPDGLAQVLDRVLPPIDELLGSIRIAGNDDAMAWAISWLMDRDWYVPD
jgi:hypothetical protein